MTEPQQPQAAPTNNQNSLDKLIDLYTIDVAYAARRQKVGNLHQEKELFRAAINKTIMESLPKKIHTHSIEELKSLSAGGDANEGFGYERGYNQALEDVRQQITKKYGRADNE